MADGPASGPADPDAGTIRQPPLFAGLLAISGLAAIDPLAVAVLTIGAASAVGAFVMGRYIPVYIPWPNRIERKVAAQ
ncbi:hypothetical protein ACQPZ2_20250 [Nocardia pseudovaccinii]|uniref:hypothetical protein n=1 Tax=Nocardia pseudovaccinii TaxID=189540 RepID=UPI003D8B2712